MHPNITITGYHDQTMQEMVTFISEKFVPQRLVVVNFLYKKSHNNAAGEFIPRALPGSGYTNVIDELTVCTKNHYLEVLRTIVHEFCHMHQDHQKLFPSGQEVVDLPNRKQLLKQKEQQARDCEVPLLKEFFDYQKSKGTYQERPWNYIMGKPK